MRVPNDKGEGEQVMISFCDSCTDRKEVIEVKHQGEIFYWCDMCKEESNE